MPRRFSIVAYGLVGLLVLSAPAAQSAEVSRSIVSQVDLDNAVAKTLKSEDSARATIKSLLERDDVKSMADGFGLDVRRAEASVSTLQGQELQHLAQMAAQADAQLSGGDEYVRISLVALLLIIIIVILVTR